MGPALAKATDWAAVTAWAAWATVAVYVVLGIFAWIQVLQARRLREEQARPFVIVDFEPGFLVYLTVEDIGRTMARDVIIRFDKPLESTLTGPREIDESPLAGLDSQRNRGDPDRPRPDQSDRVSSTVSVVTPPLRSPQVVGRPTSRLSIAVQRKPLAAPQHPDRVSSVVRPGRAEC